MNIFLNTDFLYDDTIKLIVSKLDEEDKKLKWSANYQFKIVLKDSLIEVGNCDLRIQHYDSLYYGGNIGYDVNEEYRGFGYATRAVKLLMKLAKLHDMKYVIITCDPSNLASKKVIEKAGLPFIERTNIPRDHQMYSEGLREVLVYRINI